MTALAGSSLSIAMRTLVRSYIMLRCVLVRFFVYLHCFDLNNSGAGFFAASNSSCVLDSEVRETRKNQQRINKRFIVWLYELLSHSIHKQTHDTECECDCHHMFHFVFFSLPVLPLDVFFFEIFELIFHRIYKHTSLLNVSSGKKKPKHKHTQLNDKKLKIIIFILQIAFLYFRTQQLLCSIISSTCSHARSFNIFFLAFLDLHF